MMAAKKQTRQRPARSQRSWLDRKLSSAAHHMKPNRVLARYMSGGKHQTWTAIVRSPFKAKTVHTPKSGRRAYRQLVARNKRERARQEARRRRNEAASRKTAAKTGAPSQPKTRGPVVVVADARTGRPITIRQAEAAVRAAERRVRRIEAELDGGTRPRRQSSKPASPGTPKPPLTPLQAAIKEVKQKQARQQRDAAKKTTPRAKPKAPAGARRKSVKRTTKRRTPTSPGRQRAVEAVAKLIRDQAILIATTPERSTPGAPTAPFAEPVNPRSRAARAARKGVYGAVLQRTCECGGTGRIFTYDPRTGLLKGSQSCPRHGRLARGQRRFFSRSAAVDAGLPGLAGFLAGKRDRRSKRLDKHQVRASRRAMFDPRHMGPTEHCPETAHCDGGVWDREAKDEDREAFIADYVAEREAEYERVPSRRKLRAIAARALPYEHCHTCGGLGVVPTSTQLTPDGEMPIWEWRASANLRKGHRSTGRERTTGKRMTENAAQVERRRRLPRL